MSEQNQLPDAVSELLSEEELNRKLAQMAEETPDMPEDFHARWTEQIRAEAGEKPAEKSRENRRQWRYILSAAAVFVFLIGGTLLTRNHGKVNHTDAAERKESVTAVSYEDAGTAGAANGSAAPGIMADRTAETEIREAEASYEEAPMEAAVLNAFTEEAADAAMEEYAMDEDAEAWYDAETEEAAMGNDTGEAPVAGAAMKAESAAAKNAEEPAAEPDQMPAEPDEAEEPAEEEAEETAESETAEEESGFAGFLKDLGIFTLKTLAVAAAGAVLAFLAAAVTRKIRKNKS